MDHYGDTVNCHAEKKSCISPKEDSLENISRIEKTAIRREYISAASCSETRNIMKKQVNYIEIAKETVILTAAVAVIAAAVYFFLVPSHASVSSISGLGIVLSNFIPLPLSAITMILNVVLLIIGFFTCGREFGVKTVYTSIMLPVFLGIFEMVFPNLGH